MGAQGKPSHSTHLEGCLTPPCPPPCGLGPSRGPSFTAVLSAVRWGGGVDRGEVSGKLNPRRGACWGSFSNNCYCCYCRGVMALFFGIPIAPLRSASLLAGPRPPLQAHASPSRCSSTISLLRGRGRPSLVAAAAVAAVSWEVRGVTIMTVDLALLCCPSYSGSLKRHLI